MESKNTLSLDPQVYGDQLRQQLLDRIWFYALLLALVGVPASLSRAPSTGWLPIYTVHLLVGVFVLFMFILRRRFSFQARSIVILAIIFGVS